MKRKSEEMQAPPEEQDNNEDEQSSEQSSEEESEPILENDAIYTELLAGYRLTIHSWENDLDSPHTFTQEGYTKEQVEFIIAFCNLFRRRSKFSNLYEPSASLVKDLMKTLAELIVGHKPASYSVVESFGINEELVNTARQNENFDDLSECFSQDWFPFFFSVGDSNFPFFTRVCDGIKVEFIPETIRIKDVSREFKVKGSF